MAATYVDKPFYRLQELCSRWNLTTYDLAAFALTGEIRISVPVVDLLVEVGECNDLTLDSFKRPKGTWKSKGKRRVTGAVDLLAQDAWTAIQHEPVCVRYFQNGKGSYLRIDPWGGKGFEFTVEHGSLVVMREEMERFETVRGLGTVAQHPASKVEALRGAPEKYDWDAFWRELAYMIHAEGRPTTLAGWVKSMQDWFAKQGQDAPDESTLKKKLRPLFIRLKDEAEQDSA